LNSNKVRKFFKIYCKFLTKERINEIFLNRMPRPRDFTLNSNEDFRKKELYRVFNFYIPLIRILEVGNFKTKSYKDTLYYSL